MAENIGSFGTALPRGATAPPAPLDVKLLRQAYQSDKAEQAGSDKRSDTAEISPGAQGLAAAQRVAHEALEGLRTSFGDAEIPFIEAGKLDFIKTFEAHEDFTSRGTADLILNGITSYIFGAFVASRSELTEADLDEFKEQASKGVGQGFEQAGEYLKGLELFSGEVKEDAEETIDMVYKGLDTFIEEQRKLLRDQTDRGLV